MRRLTKLPEPNVLSENKTAWLDEYLREPDNNYKKTRYRNNEIKKILKKETGFKCVYCESKIGHNTPGDVEHKIPSSKNQLLHFSWNNLTIACGECNRRKNDYYEVGSEFLDPYTEDVEELVLHHGPVVSSKLGNVRAEITVRKLEFLQREQLIFMKIEKIRYINNLLERIKREADPILKALLSAELEESTKHTAEYSAMILSIIADHGIVLEPEVHT